MSEVQMIYGQEEVLFEQLREIYGGYEKYWNNQHVEEVYSKEQIKQYDVKQGLLKAAPLHLP